MEREYLETSFQRAGIPLTEQQAQQFLTYAHLLIEWNQKINLTAITEFDDIVWKHFIDSCALLLSKNVSRETLGGKVIDVGTGAGFPGIPLKIMMPGMSLTLLDSLNKRIDFLKEVGKQCKLEKVTYIHGRAEDIAQDPKFREQYQMSVSRAVAPLATLYEYNLPFLKRGGIFVAYKGDHYKEEVRNSKKAVSVFGGEMIKEEPFILPGTDLQRCFVFVKKVQNTPKKYPRKAGTPLKKPILG